MMVRRRNGKNVLDIRLIGDRMIEIVIMFFCILITFLLLGIFDEILTIRDLLVLEVFDGEGDLRDRGEL